MGNPSTQPRGPSRPLRQHKENTDFSGGSRHQASPEAKSLRWDGGSGQAAIRDVAHDHASVDWPTYPLRTPSGDGPAPIPYRSKCPAKRTTQKGIDSSRPVTEARMKRSEIRGC